MSQWDKTWGGILAPTLWKPGKGNCPACFGSGIGEVIYHGTEDNGEPCLESLRCEHCDGIGSPTDNKMEHDFSEQAYLIVQNDKGQYTVNFEAGRNVVRLICADKESAKILAAHLDAMVCSAEIEKMMPEDL